MKKLTINSIAVGNLKQRRKQYAVMIIGIVLAMVFSSSVIFMLLSMYNSVTEMRNERLGKQSLIWANVTEDDIEKAKENKVLGKLGYAHVLGSLESTDESYMDKIKVAWLDDEAFNLANPIIAEGRMPVAENEIAVERIMLSKLGVTAKVGDEITLNLYPQNGNAALEECKPVTYKLVGTLKNKVNYITFTSGSIDDMHIPSAFVCKNTDVDLGGKESLTCYARFNNSIEILGGHRFYKYLESVGYDLHQNAVDVNSTYKVLHMNNDASNLMQQIVFVVVIIAVLMMASCLVIVNSFNLNLNERKKQIGMFCAIGATKRQIRDIFAREALIIALIATPVSCALSAVIVKAIITVMGDGFFFKLNAWAVLLSVIFCIACVMLSALIPMRSASRISPIQSIRNIDNTRTLNKKKIKSKKSFDVPKLLASRSLTFDKRKQITVSVVLIVGILVSGYAMSIYSFRSKDRITIDHDYSMGFLGGTGYSDNINYTCTNEGITEQDRRLVDNNEYIGSSYGMKEGNVDLLLPFDTSEYRMKFSHNYGLNFDYVYDKEKQKVINETNYKEYMYEKRDFDATFEKASNLYNVDDFSYKTVRAFDTDYLSTLDKYIYDGKINIDKINSGEEIILVAPKRIGFCHYYYDGEYYGVQTASNEEIDEFDCFGVAECDFRAGEEIEIGTMVADKPLVTKDGRTDIPDNVKVTKKKVKIGAILTDVPSYFSTSGLYVLTSPSFMNSLIPNLKYKELYFNLNTSCTDEVDKSVMENIKEAAANSGNIHCVSNYGFAQEQETNANKFLIAAISVSILLFVISISIINNTLSSDIKNSKSKIGTLRAVGADENCIVKSYIHQLLSMLLWGSGIGLIGFFGSFGIYALYCHQTDNHFDMIFNPSAAIVFIVLAFLVCSLNLWLKVRKEMKNSIVENIREL